VPLSNGQNDRAPLRIGPIGFIFCLANAAVLTAAAARFLKWEQPYGDLVAGSLIWTNADKGFDFRVFHTFLGSFGLFFVCLLALCRRFDAGQATKQTLERAFAIALAPGALWLGTLLATNSPGLIPMESVFSAAALLGLLFALSRQRLRLRPETIKPVLNNCLLVLFFSFFTGLGLATTLARVAHVHWSTALTFKVVGGTCLAMFAAMLVIVLRSSTPERLERRIVHLLFGSQTLLPLLLTVVIPPVLIVNGARVVPRISGALALALAVVTVIGWAAPVRRWKRSVSALEGFPSRRLVPWAIVPIAVFLSVDQGMFPTFSGDDFHLGEHLLPWQQLHDFGKLPFVDFVPVHPLMDLLVGAINAVFFDGTLANYENSRVILFAIGAALTFVTVERFTNVGMALCLAFAANLWDRLLLVPALLAVLCYPPLFQRRSRWLLSCGFLCVLALLYNPAVGVAMTLASAPVALFQGWRLFVENRNALFRVSAGCAAMAAIVAAIPLTRAISFGFMQFLIDNGRTAAVAHGLEWRAHTSQMAAVKGALANPFVWEALRFLWIFVVLVAGCVFVLEMRDRRNARSNLILMSAMCCLFLFFLAGWTLNRIDPFVPSRTGEVSYLACLYILPLLLFAMGHWRSTCLPVFALTVGFFQQGLSDFHSGSKAHAAITARALVEKPTGVVSLPPGLLSQNASALALPNLGQIYASEEQFESLRGLQTALRTLLRPGETYLDLTNRQAAYFYLGLPAATSYGAPWLTANTQLQDQLLREIELRRPPAVWIAPAQEHDTGTAAIRTYKLYRYLTLHYLPVAMNGQTFLVEPRRAQTLTGTPAEQLQLLRATFDNPSLGRLPAAWGGSFERLSALFTPIEPLPATKDMPVADGSATTLHNSGANYSGSDVDFVRFDFASNLSRKSNMELEIRWASEYGDGSARFTATNGTNLVPLGAYPAWLLSRAISKIGIAPVAPPAKLKYLVMNAELLRLKD
jgi:hypothetical protein